MLLNAKTQSRKVAEIKSSCLGWRSLSLVVPVYNAPELAQRVLAALPTLAARAATCGFKLIEAIFVDDGSQPQLELSSFTFHPSPFTFRLLRNAENRGKGCSVRRGALEARGDWVLMSDVDMSAPFTEFPKLAARADAWMVCGSRHGRPGMPLRRRVLSWLFHLCVKLAGVKGIHDTQCGFKLFRMDVMRPLFDAQRIERFAFDVELIRRVQDKGGEVAEVPVKWEGGARSSLRVLRDAPRMLFDLIRF